MTEALTQLRTEQASHWYTTDGAPMHEVPNKSNGGVRPTTLKDARKLNLVPSVTNVLRIIDKPALNSWKTEQAILAVMTTPRKDGEQDDAFVKRILSEGIHKEETARACELGHRIHGGCEDWVGMRPVDPEIKPYIEGVIEFLHERRDREFTAERVLVGEGYAGRADLIVRESPFEVIIYDFKSAKAIPKDDSPYFDHRLQLAAYAKAFLKMVLNVRDGECSVRVRVGNIYISTSDIGQFKVIMHDEWELAYEHGFRHALGLWQFHNNYVPAQ